MEGLSVVPDLSLHVAALAVFISVITLSYGNVIFKL